MTLPIDSMGIGISAAAGAAPARENLPMIEHPRRHGDPSSQLEPQWFDLNRLVDRLRLILPPLLGARVTLKLDARADSPLVFTDPRELEQAVLFLAVEARDAMPGGGALSIVLDDPGAEPNAHVRLTFRYTANGPRQFAAAGPFALPLVRRVVEEGGGTVDAESDAISGTTVALSWRAKPSTAAAAPAPAHIVVADDQPFIRAWIRDVLEDGPRAVVVLEAEDGGEALRHIRNHPVDLLITDLVMPGHEGIETIRAVRREAPHIAILAISGAMYPEYLRMARALGADAALAKPLSAAELLAAIWKLLPAQP